MENLPKVFQTKNKNMKRLSFVTQFKIEFLLPLTSCRKMLGKMTAYGDQSYNVFCTFYTNHFPHSLKRHYDSSFLFFIVILHLVHRCNLLQYNKKDIPGPNYFLLYTKDKCLQMFLLQLQQ